MRELIQTEIRRYAVSMLLIRETGTKEIRCLFQPVRSKSRQHMVYSDSPFGVTSQAQYVFLGDPADGVAVGDVLKQNGRRYRFRRVEPICFGNETIYLWGLCIEEGDDDRWNNLS